MRFFSSKRVRRRWRLSIFPLREAETVVLPEAPAVATTCVAQFCRPLSIATGLPFDLDDPSPAEQAYLREIEVPPPSSRRRRPGTARLRPSSIAHFSEDVTDGARRLYNRASQLFNPQDASPSDISPAASTGHTPPPSRPMSSWRKRASTLVNLSRPTSTFFSSPSTTEGSTSANMPCIKVDGEGPRTDHAMFDDLLPGAAARAAAARAQSSQVKLPIPVVMTGESIKSDRDAESGIGIDLRGVSDEWVNMSGSARASVIRADPVAYLPVELSTYILTFLDHASLARAERVSKGWQDAATSQHVWKEIFRTEHRSAWEALQTSTVTYDTTALGMGKQGPDQDWKKILCVRKELKSKWERGNLAAAYVQGHTDSVYCVQFDDSKFITGSRDQTIRIWDMRTFHVTKILGNPAVTGPLMAAVYAQQNGLAKAGVPAAAAPSLALCEDGSPPMFHDASILCLQFDSEILVTGSSDASCIVWSIVDDYKPIRRLQHHTLGVLDVCIDRKHIVTCSKDTTVCVWDRQTGEMLRQMSGHRGPVNAIQMRGNLVVSLSGDALIKLWNLDSGRCVREFAGHTRGLACVQFSEDSRLIVSGGNDHVIRIWDANTGECIRELHGHTSLVRSLHLDSANGRVVSGSYDQSVKVFDLETGNLLIDFPKWTSSWILCAKADYRRILATSQCGRTFIMDFGKFVPGVDMLASTVGRMDLGPDAIF